MWKKNTMIDDASGCWKEVPLLEATTPEQQRLIIALVKKISLEKITPEIDISALEKRLDLMMQDIWNIKCSRTHEQ